ncbi:uncharacterized protein PSFLO_06928 [Pseudozyma flocculosa]|uniref:HIT domain-containing protein n=2 Tax=Pseudozyma flocculosa TaxID=84751 RepID=A0A5C3FBE8_9BASI|nr:uncharacterized protein PSFLO_06928 [Pseudozyma flocculosa]
MTGSDTQHWQAVLAPEERYGDENPDHVDSKSGPRMTRDVLDEWKRRLSPYEGAEDDLTFDGPASDDNLFARIVRGEEEQWRVYQDPSSVAVLTPFPNGPLKTVLVPRHHAASDVLGLDRAEFLALLRSTHSALRIFDRVDAIGVAIVMEGFEIDYAHIKLTPRFHGNKSERCAFTHCYSGFLTSQRGPDLDAKQALDCHRLLVRVWPRD